MDLSTYKNFIAIVDAGSLTKAAVTLHIAQPALTHQLKILQKKYGAPLIETQQGQRQIKLTSAGQIFYNKAKNLLSIEQGLQEDIMAHLSGREGILRLSMSPSVSMSFIHEFLADFSRSNPNISYDIFEVSIEEQANQLLSGLTEIAIANAPLHRSENFTVHFTVQDSIAAILNTKSPYVEPLKHLQEQDYLPLLPTLPLCISRGCMRPFFDFCTASDIRPMVHSTSTTKSAALQWAMENIGVAIVPIEYGEILPSSLISLPLSPDKVQNAKIFYSLKNRSLSPLAQNFLEFCMKKLPALA